VGTRQWSFGQDGTLTLPNSTAIADATETITYNAINSLNYESGKIGTFATLNLDATDPTSVGGGWIVNGPGVTDGVVDGTDTLVQIVSINTSTGNAFIDGESYTFTSPTLFSVGSKLTVNGKDWKFKNDGALTLPTGGDVINSTGVSQLAKRAEGSWTVATGTNTYSFTVPMDGTYTMWVKGNIPNGIITWNATLSITNNNVPAIGTQYAWNYTGGGSPILLTAIPDQIRGSAGVISTDATYVGTTSNRFDFGISNSSGATQTIYYGYTKV
jgi:hypothetical protein